VSIKSEKCLTGQVSVQRVPFARLADKYIEKINSNIIFGLNAKR
jgi:hypothetical protein